MHLKPRRHHDKRGRIARDLPGLQAAARSKSRAASANPGVGQVMGLTGSRLVGECCQSWQPRLIMLHLHMPHMEGIAVLSSLSSILPADRFVPTLTLTADAMSAAKEQALAAVAKNFVTKPFDRTEVHEVDELVRRSL